MDSHVAVPRQAVASTVLLRSEVPERHPSAGILGRERLGAGVAIAADRVLTAHYLILGASRVELDAADGRPRKVRHHAIDHESGLGLVWLEGPPLHPATLDPDVPAPGLPVFLLTCGSDGARKGASGHVSAVGPFEAFWEYMLDRAIMTTTLNPGLAGAPLFDGRGRLRGVVSLGLMAVGRYSLAIPMDLFLARQELLEDDTRPRAPRAWIGLYPHGVDGGVVVGGLVEQGPAERAGLERGDLVVSVDGTPVGSLRDLYAAIWRRAPGEPLTFQVLREASLRVVEVVAGDRYAFYK